MKICLINNLYKPYSKGGAEKILELLVDGFTRMGHQVFVISSEPRFRKKVQEADVYRIKSFYYDLGRIPIFFRLFWHLFDMFDILSAFRIKKILRKESPDLVITNNLKGISFLVPLMVKQLGIRHIHVLHDMQLIHPTGLMMNGEEEKIAGFFAKVYIALSRQLFDYSGGVVSPSKWLLDQHLGNGFFSKKKSLILPNPLGTNTDAVVFDRKNNDVLKFLYVGQLERHKGIEMLVDVFLQVKNADLKIVGSGSLYEDIKMRTAENSGIAVLGKKTGEEVLRIMAEADCLIVPSLCYENSPTVIYEAMSVGLPVLASRIGGVVEFLDRIGGFLFVPGDKDDLRSKIEDIVADPSRLEAIRIGYEKNIDNYSLDGYVCELLKNFLDI